MRIVEADATEYIEPGLVERVIGRAHGVPVKVELLRLRSASASAVATTTSSWATYRYQGRGPIKVPRLEVGVNITVELPVIRTFARSRHRVRHHRQGDRQRA